MNFHKPPNTFVDIVSLKVSKLERSLAYYNEIIGFQIMKKTDRSAVLTADGHTPLVLLEQPEQPLPKSARHPGLYHFALLLPTRAHLGAFLRHIMKERVPIGASDHIVSEAIYLSDPDGNGIEVYADRPVSLWQTEFGKIRMSTDPLQTESLLSEAEDEWNGLPSRTIMGHIHLHVSNLEKAQQFYCDGLGFEVVYHYPQALFMSTGGYHHHIAVNTWNFASQEKPLKNQVGLDWFSIVFPSNDARQHAIENLQQLGFSAAKKDAVYVVEDPSGNCVYLKC